MHKGVVSNEQFAVPASYCHRCGWGRHFACSNTLLHFRLVSPVSQCNQKRQSAHNTNCYGNSLSSLYGPTFFVMDIQPRHCSYGWRCCCCCVLLIQSDMPVTAFGACGTLLAPLRAAVIPVPTWICPTPVVGVAVVRARRQAVFVPYSVVLGVVNIACHKCQWQWGNTDDDLLREIHFPRIGFPPPCSTTYRMWLCTWWLRVYVLPKTLPSVSVQRWIYVIFSRLKIRCILTP